MPAKKDANSWERVLELKRLPKKWPRFSERHPNHATMEIDSLPKKEKEIARKIFMQINAFTSTSPIFVLCIFQPPIENLIGDLFSI